MNGFSNDWESQKQVISSFQVERDCISSFSNRSCMRPSSNLENHTRINLNQVSSPVRLELHNLMPFFSQLLHCFTHRSSHSRTEPCDLLQPHPYPNLQLLTQSLLMQLCVKRDRNQRPIQILRLKQNLQHNLRIINRSSHRPYKRVQRLHTKMIHPRVTSIPIRRNPLRRRDKPNHPAKTRRHPYAPTHIRTNSERAEIRSDKPSLTSSRSTDRSASVPWVLSFTEKSVLAVVGEAELRDV